MPYIVQFSRCEYCPHSHKFLLDFNALPDTAANRFGPNAC